MKKWAVILWLWCAGLCAFGQYNPTQDWPQWKPSVLGHVQGFEYDVVLMFVQILDMNLFIDLQPRNLLCGIALDDLNPTNKLGRMTLKDWGP